MIRVSSREANLSRPVSASPAQTPPAAQAPWLRARRAGYDDFSLDHLIRAYQERLRDGETQCFGSLAVDHQFKFRGLLDGQVSRVSPLENLVHVGCGAAIIVRVIRPVAH